ncbi:MAG: hypothetical protein WC827_00195 [Candidatus Paceibacterota bacterium]|jgi:hypothetical protein
MKEEEIKKIVTDYNQRLSLSGNSLEFVDFKNNKLTLKFNCADKTEFKVQGKIVTMAEGIKQEIVKYFKMKIANIIIIFI